MKKTKKMKLRLEDLEVESFETAPEGDPTPQGTVFAYISPGPGNTCDAGCTNSTCGGTTCQATCVSTCNQTCPPTCHTCAGTCGPTCQTCGGACGVTCPESCGTFACFYCTRQGC